MNPEITKERPGALISVISPAHNASAFCGAWLESIAAQEYGNLEVILVDDGSDEAEALALQEAVQSAPPYVQYLRQAKGGPAAARNLAIEASHGEYVAFLDLDDRWAKGHLTRLATALTENPEAGIAQGTIRKFLTTDSGELLYCSDPYRFVNLGAALYRRTVFAQLGAFDAGLRFGEDFDLIIRCWERGILKLDLPDVSLLYHRHEGNMTNGQSIVDLGAVRVYKRRLDRSRAGLVDPAVVLARGVSFPDYIGRTVGPFDEGVREPVVL